MDPRHKKLYIKWSQSPRVELYSSSQDDSHTDELSESKTKFLIPSDLLRHRSQPFHELLSKSQPRSEVQNPSTSTAFQPIDLNDTPLSTLEDFYIWSLSPSPQVNANATFEDVVHLGVFAERHQIHALSNQVTDVIKRKLARDVWQLHAGLVDEVYTATANTPGTSDTDDVLHASQLCELTRAALRSVARSIMEGGTEADADERDQWKAACLKHAHLGWNFIEAGAREWDPAEFKEGTCRYHIHDERRLFTVDAPFYNEDERGVTWCPYERDECFPEPYDVEEGPLDDDAVPENTAAKEEVDETVSFIPPPDTEMDESIPLDLVDETPTAPPESEVEDARPAYQIEPEDFPPPEELLVDEEPSPPTLQPAEPEVSDIKSETEVSHTTTTIDDEVNGSLTWDEIIGKNRPTGGRTLAFRSVNGGGTGWGGSGVGVGAGGSVNGGGSVSVSGSAENGGLKTEGVPELQARMLDENNTDSVSGVEGPTGAAWGLESVGEGKVNGVEVSKVVLSDEGADDKVSGTVVSEVVVEEKSSPVVPVAEVGAVKVTGSGGGGGGKKGKKKRGSMNRS